MSIIIGFARHTSKDYDYFIPFRVVAFTWVKFNWVLFKDGKVPLEVASSVKLSA